MVKDTIRQIATQYSTPVEFKLGNHAMWAIAKGKGWLREFYPDYIIPVPEYASPAQPSVITTPDDAALRDALDDYIVNLRIRQTNKTLKPKIPVKYVIAELERILNKY